MPRLPPFLAMDHRHRAVGAGLLSLVGVASLGDTVITTSGFSGSQQRAATPTRTPPPTEPTLMSGALVHPE
jgi:hypothetical protein